jgi:hypothetical protein
MSKLDWEKQNKAELPKLKRRESQRTKVLKAYENGAKRERQRIIKLLEEDADNNYYALQLIKGEQK